MPRVRPRIVPARVGVPVRGAEPGEGRHEHHAVGGVHGGGDRLALGGRPDDLQPVAQPLDGRAGHEDRTLERVGQLAVRGAPRRRGQQAGVRALERRAGVGEDERTRAVGALGVAGVEAGLPEERRLLVAGEARDRQLEPGERRRVGGRDLAPVGDQVGQGVAGYAEEAAQLVGPVAGRQVHQQGPRGVGDVGDVPGAAGHPGDEVGVDGADGVAPGLDERPRVRLVLGEPGQLGAGEVGVEPQPGQLGDPLLVALARAGASQIAAVRRSCQTIARRGEPRVSRSHSSTVSRWLVMPTACSSDPSYDARTSRVASSVACQISSGACSTQPGLGEVLGELLVALGRDPAVGRDDDGRDAGRAGVDGEDAHLSSSAARRISSTFSSIQVAGGVDAHLVVLGADPGVEVGEAALVDQVLDLGREGRR